MSADRFWLGVLITLAVIFFYCVSLTGDDAEGSGAPPPPSGPPSSHARRCRPHGHLRASDRRIWHELDTTDTGETRNE